MRLIVMGTGPFAVPSLDGLRAEGHDIPLVVTRPVTTPAPKKPNSRPVADWANAQGIPLFEPPSINTTESIEYLIGYRADLFFVCDYGQILSRECLSASRLGGVNLHGSILPKHRGAAPVQWSVLTGDTETGVTTILMTPKLDAGPALTVRSTDVLPDETAGELEPRLAHLGVEAILDAIRQLESWDGASPIGQVQNNSLASRAPRFQKQHGQLDFRLPAYYLVRLIRACQPWPGTFADLTLTAGKSIRVLVRSARALPNSLGCIATAPDSNHPEGSLQPAVSNPPVGMVRPVDSAEFGLDWSDPWRILLAVQAADGIVLINRIQPAGKREMSVEEFLRGHPLESDSRFQLPDELVPQLIA